MNRRKTEVQKPSEELRESEDSLNDRTSNLEGSVNKIGSIMPERYNSEFKTETFKDSVQSRLGLGRCDSKRSGSGSGRQHSGIKSFIEVEQEDGNDGPFATAETPTFHAEDIDEEDCNADDIDEHGAQNVPAEQSIKGKPLNIHTNRSASSGHEFN